MPLGTGKVVENTVQALRDTGCNGVIVKREIVNEDLE